MSTERHELDVVVVGAGPAGSAAAYMLADAGLDVAVVEARPFSEAGPRWVATIVEWAFESARLARPEPPERRSTGDRSLVLDAEGHVHVKLEESPAWSVDLPLLTARLQDLGRAAGVRGFDSTRLVELRLCGGRPEVLEAVRAGADGTPRRLELRARLFVDAAGLGGALRRRVPVLARDCPRVPPHHLCTAAEELSRVADGNGARDFVERHGARPGEVLAHTGVAGGFSTMWIHVDEDLETVDLLAGSIADGRHAGGPELVRAFRAQHPWIGPRLSGGAGLIPLRRPYDRLSAPGVALVGNAACQVFPAHGSGVGLGLMAARLLADAVGRADDPGSETVTWAYQAAFMRTHGAVLGVYDLFRRYSQSLSGNEVAALLRSGVVTRASYRAALAQRIPRPSPGDLVSTLRGVFRAPRQSARLATLLPRMAAVYALYRGYPDHPDDRRLRIWSATVASLFGESADVGSRSARSSRPSAVFGGLP